MMISVIVLINAAMLLPELTINPTNKFKLSFKCIKKFNSALNYINKSLDLLNIKLLMSP